MINKVMSALEKLEITIADRLHDFTDKGRMPSLSKKSIIVDYIRELLITIFKDTINITGTRFEDLIKGFAEDTIMNHYYPGIKESVNKLTIQTINDLYTTKILDFIYNIKNNGKRLSMSKEIFFKGIPQWLYNLYNGNKSFMMDVTLLTEQDICKNIVPMTGKTKEKLILKSIATEYDRNVENKTIQNCTRIYSILDENPPPIVLLRKTDNELLGFDSIELLNNNKEKELVWKIKNKSGKINIDKLIIEKKSSRNIDSTMGLPLFLDFIAKILKAYIQEPNKKNNFNILNNKIKDLYGLSFTNIPDTNLYVLCLTDLKSMGDLLQVKMAQLSNSIFISNDRVTCLMSSKCYNNPTILTRKVDPDKTIESPTTSLREIYVFDESDTLFTGDIKEQLEKANRDRIEHEEAIKKKKVEFIQLLKTFLSEKYIDILQGVKDVLISTIKAYKNELEKAKDTIFTEESKKRKREEVYYFNYDIYQYRIIVILLNYYLGFITLLIKISSINTSSIDSFDVTIYDNFINYDIDSSKEEQENYISLSLTLLYSNIRDLIYYIIPENIRKKRLDKDLIDDIPLFNYPSYNIIKCGKDLHIFNIRSQLKYLSTSIQNVSYQVGFSYSAETLRQFDDTIIELQDMSEAFVEEINTKVGGRRGGGNTHSRKKRIRSNNNNEPSYTITKSSNNNDSFDINNMLSRKRKKIYTESLLTKLKELNQKRLLTKLKELNQKRLLTKLKELNQKRLLDETILQNNLHEYIEFSNNLIDTVIEFLINYLNILKQFCDTLTLIKNNNSYSTIEDIQEFKTYYNNSKSDYDFTCLLLFQILFIVDYYDLALPIYKGSPSSSSLLLKPFLLSEELKTNLSAAIDKYSEQHNKLMGLIETASYSPMEIDGGFKKRFQFSQKFISQFANRLKL